MALNDAKLNAALQRIFDKMQEDRLVAKRAGSVPPLEAAVQAAGTLKHYQVQKTNVKKPQDFQPSGKQPMKSETPPVGQGASRRRDLPPLHAQHAHTPSPYMQPVSLKSRGKNKNKKERTSKLFVPPPSNPLVERDIEIATHGPSRFHSKFCTECSNREKHLGEMLFTKLIQDEKEERMALRAVEIDDFTVVRNFWLRVLADQREAAKQARSDIVDNSHSIKQKEKELQTVHVAEKQKRRLILTDWEVGWDEICAFHKLSVRNYNQISEMKRKDAQRKAELEREEAQQRESDALNRWVSRTTRAREIVENDETYQRKHLDDCDVSIRNAVFQIFSDQRKQLQQHEQRVQKLMVKHQHRLTSLSAEKEKILVDEGIARERVVAAERKGFEVTVCMEPDLRKRARHATVQREKREARERVEMQTNESEERQNTTNEEKNTRNDLENDCLTSHQHVTRRDNHRGVISERIAIREKHEEKQQTQMFEEENYSWQKVRFEFERDMKFDAMEEEMKERRSLLEYRQRELTRILNNQRARQRMSQGEQRYRSELERETCYSRADVIDQIARLRDLFALEWSEGIKRTTYIDELAQAYEELKEYEQASRRTAELSAAHPVSKLDKVIADDSYTIRLKESKLCWFYYCVGVSLLKGAVLKSNSSGGSSITDVKNFPVKVQLLNPIGGSDDMVECPLLTESLGGSTGGSQASLKTAVSSSHLREMMMTKQKDSHLLEGLFTGNINDLFDNIRFVVKGHPNRTRMLPRVIAITLDDELEIVVHVSVFSAICSLPEVFVSMGKFYPLKQFVQPPVSKVRMVRVILQLSPETISTSVSRLQWPIPDDFFVHPKQGIMKDGKVVLRVNSQSPEKIDVEFDNLPTLPIARALSAVTLVRGDDPHPLDPLELYVCFTNKDETLTQVQQLLDVDGNVERPRLRLTSVDLAVRCACPEMPEKLAPHVPMNPQHVFHNAVMTFPAEQQDVIGGYMKLSFSDDTYDGKATLSIQPFGHFNRMTINEATGELCCQENKNKEPVGVAKLIGCGTGSMTIQFPPTGAMSTEMINTMMRSIVIECNRRVAVKGVIKPMLLQIAMDVNKDALGETIKADLKVQVLPPTLEVPNKSYNFGYREGTGQKPLPSMEIKANQMKLLPEARLEVRIVQGAQWMEDILDVPEKEFDQTEKLFVFKHKGMPIAWWDSKPGKELIMHLSGDVGIKEWMREAITDPYAPENFVSNSNELFAAGVNVLLRSICYDNQSSNPQILKKVVQVCLDDGRTGRSSLAFDLTIESVDDPTELVIRHPELVYRQLSLATKGGFPLLPNCALVDPDSDNFHGGFIVVEGAATEPGDTLLMLKPQQQEELIYRRNGSTSVSCLSYLLSVPDDVAGSEVPYLCAVIDEQPRKLLEIIDGRDLYFAGEPIGTIFFKGGGLAPCSTLKLNFFSETKSVPFDTVEYVLQCVGYENYSSKMKEGNRTFSFRLNCTGSKNTTETFEKITVIGYPALVSLPSYSTSLKFEEGSKSKPLLKGIATTMSPALTVQHEGFIRAKITGRANDVNDELLFEKTDAIQVKEKSLFFGKELAGVMNARKEKNEMQSLYVTFGKVNNQSLCAMLKSLSFVNRSHSLESEDRLVEVHVSITNNEEEMVSLFIPIAVSNKNNPTEINLPSTSLVYMSGSSPQAIGKGCTVRDVDTKSFSKGSVLEVGMHTKQSGSEQIVIRSTPSCRVEWSTPEHTSIQFIPTGIGSPVGSPATTGPICTISKGIKSAKTTSSTSVEQAGDQPEEGGEAETFLFSKSVIMELCPDFPVPSLALLIETIHYYNNTRGDRGEKKMLILFLKAKAQPQVRVPIMIDIAPPLLDFSFTPAVRQILGGTATAIAETGKVQILAEPAQFLELSATLVTGHDLDAGDTLSSPFPVESGLVLNASDGTIVANKKTVARIVTQTPEKVLFRSDNPTNFVAQQLLRSFQLLTNMNNTTQAGGKEVMIDIKGECSYGAKTETVHVRST